MINPFMHNVVKWPNILQKSYGAHTARFLKYVWPFYNIMHERVNAQTENAFPKIFSDHNLQVIHKDSPKFWLCNF